MTKLLLASIVPRLYLGVFIFLYAISANAITNTIAIPIEDLAKNIGSGDLSSDDPLNVYVLQLLQNEIDKTGLQLANGELIAGFSTPAMHTDKCSTDIKISESTAYMNLKSGTNFTIDLNGISDIVVSANLVGSIHMQADAAVEYGIRLFGNCEVYATDHGVVSANMNFDTYMNFDLKLTPSYDAQNQWISVDKYGVLDGNLNLHGIDIDGDFGGLNVTGLIIEAAESILKKRFESAGKNAYRALLIKTNNKLNGLDANGVPDPTITSVFNSTTIFELPPEIHDSAFLQLLITEFGLPEILFSAIDDAPGQIIYMLMVLDKEEKRRALAEFGSVLACDAIKQNLELSLHHAPLYTLNNGVCEVASNIGMDFGRYFSDPVCIKEIAFKPESGTEFCSTSMGPDSKQLLGNAAAWQADTQQPNDPLPDIKSQKWTTTLGTRLDIGVLPKENMQQPFMKRLLYKTVKQTGRGSGTCELEMRVYSPDIAVTELPAVLALHGGTWKHRGFSAVGLEASTTFLTNQGLMVFAPFYRLSGESDANIECNGVGWREIVADINDALDWVKQHGSALGARTQSISLFGQSAGGHLAIWLATERPNDVGKVLAFYPPLDAIDFIQESALGYQAYAQFGLNSLAGLFGAKNGTSEVNLHALDLSLVDYNNPPQSLQDFIPDNVFDLTNLDPANLPLYISRCAVKTGVDLETLDLALPPVELVACMRQDLSAFILSSSFIHKLDSTTPPLTVIQGTSDSYLPLSQSAKLCTSLSNVTLPTDLTDLPTLIAQQCGAQTFVNIVQGAEHMLDFGLCMGEVCPAGKAESPTRAAVTTALSNSFEWLAEPMAEPQDHNNFANESNDTGIGAGWALLWLLIAISISRFRAMRLTKL